MPPPVHYLSLSFIVFLNDLLVEKSRTWRPLCTFCLLADQELILSPFELIGRLRPLGKYLYQARVDLRPFACVPFWVAFSNQPLFSVLHLLVIHQELEHRFVIKLYRQFFLISLRNKQA